MARIVIQDNAAGRARQPDHGGWTYTGGLRGATFNPVSWPNYRDGKGESPRWAMNVSTSNHLPLGESPVGVGRGFPD